MTLSRIFGAIAVLLLATAAAICLKTTAAPAMTPTIPFLLAAIALAASLYYTPDYLHLTVDPSKSLRWAVRIRWRIIGAALLIGLIAASSLSGRVAVAAAAVWLLAANLLARRVVPAHFAALWFATTDLLLLFGLLLWGDLDLTLAGILLAAAVHVAVLMSEEPLFWALALILCCWLLLVLHFMQQYGPLPAYVFPASLIMITALATGWLVARTQDQNEANIAAAMQELQEFTGYSEDRIRELWATSNQQLARNWQAAALAEDDRERLAQWYRDNSELYLFAISGYNLEYKRIRSNMKVLKFARGSTLDYGAGNGELLLELARRGHRVTYYDVEGVTMRFARQRAQRYGLAMDFFSTKEALLAAAHKKGFDTIFSFDVLEHLPDLPGELSFLSSMLNSGGLMVFDVPAGSTKAHPMHLNHNLNVLAYMRAKGLEDMRGLSLRIPLRKEEKYVFHAPSASTVDQRSSA
ncbi:MAG TPA: methyltransferase domain-containing protein [Candidatus Angelobacter sp.]